MITTSNYHNVNVFTFCISDDAEDDVDQLFYFESDHIALRENADYKSLTRAVVQLEAQRIKAISDLDTLYTVQRQAIENPINFVDKLQKKVLQPPKFGPRINPWSSIFYYLC